MNEVWWDFSCNKSSALEPLQTHPSGFSSIVTRCGGSNPSWRPKIPGSGSGFCHCVVLWLGTSNLPTLGLSICEVKQLHFMIPKCPAGSLLLGFQTKYLELTPYGRVLARSKWFQDMPGVLGRETSKGCKDRRTFWRWWGTQEDLLSYRWWGFN